MKNKKLISLVLMTVAVLAIGFVPQDNVLAGNNYGHWGDKVYGCTDPEAVNYNPNANKDDGSCEYEQCTPGCTDPAALNYDPEATEDDDSCQYPEPNKVTISGLKFNDLNNSGTNNSEPSLKDWTIYLDGSGGFYESTLTDEDGEYSFEDVPEGNYTLCEIEITDWKQTYPNTHDGCYDIEVDESSDYSNHSFDFGNHYEEPEVPGCTDPHAKNYDSDATVDDGSCEYHEPDTFSISGLKFNDQNNNGGNDSEHGLSGWTITISNGHNFSDSTVTDSEGDYSFPNLDPGTYTVCEINQSGWTQTYPTDNNGCYIIELTDSNLNGFEFGNYLEVDVPGCTDETASNYNPNATSDDGSCEYPSTEDPGCMDANALNYNPNATTDDGSCEYPEEEIPGCTDPAATNYNPKATVDDGSCTYGGANPQPELEITKTVDKEFTNRETTIVYTVVIENVGRGRATNVVLRDTLPQHFTYVSSGSDYGEWKLGNMARGDKRTVVFDVFVGKEATIGVHNNKVTATSSNHRTISDDVDIEVRGPEVKGEEAFPVLEIVKTASKETVKKESYFTYTVSVTNTGLAPAENVVIVDNLPAGFIASSNNATTVTWNEPFIEVGETWTRTFTVYITSIATVGSHVNIATAEADNHEPVSDSATVKIGELPWTAGPINDKIVSEMPAMTTSTDIYVLWSLFLAVLGAIGLISIFARKYKTALQTILFAGLIVGSFAILAYPTVSSADIRANIALVDLIQTEEEPEAEPLVSNRIVNNNWLVIDKIGVEIPIVDGSDETALEYGAWLMPDTSTPEVGGNTVLAGHRYKYRPPHKETFYNLDKLVLGDQISIYFEGEHYQYLVTSTEVVEPTDVEVLNQTDESTITLITCAPLFSDKYRLIIKAELL